MNILSYLKSFISNKQSGGTSASSIQKVSASDTLKELENFLQSRYDEYLPEKTETPEVPSYQRYEYEAPSDESIRESAEKELGDYLNQGESSIKNEYAAKEKSLNANKADSESLYNGSQEKLKAAYEQAAQSLSDDSLKRGLARSSIALNNQAAASKAYMQNLNELIKERDRKIADIDRELNDLDSQLQSALDSFKISYAAKLTQRINELTEEREKNVREAIKYNNSMAKQEYEQQVEKAERDNKLKDEAQKEQDLIDSMSDSQKEQFMREFYQKAVEALDSLPQDEAKRLFNESSIFRDNLNDYYYYTLYYRYR